MEIMNKDTLGDRIKRYEAASKPLLTRRMPVMVRVDGKAFHTFTRGCNKPYDDTIIQAMVYAAKETAKQMQGFKLGYVQSDEATFLITDYETLETGAWFDYEVNKVVSITASLFTAYFNQYWQNSRDVFNGDKGREQIALFDARAFNIPQDDWQNAFIWRQRDWERNSVQMLARSLYSQKELHGKKVPELLKLINDRDKDWESLDGVYKWGTFILPDIGLEYYGKVDYKTVTMLANLNKEDVDLFDDSFYNWLLNHGVDLAVFESTKLEGKVPEPFIAKIDLNELKKGIAGLTNG